MAVKVCSAIYLASYDTKRMCYNLGIGTGWSTSIPNYNPADVVENLRRFLRGEDMVEMQPWYRGTTDEARRPVTFLLF